MGPVIIEKRTNIKLDLLKMQHARAVAELNSYVAEANWQLAQGGWRCDWSIGMNQAIAECREIEKTIEENLDKVY